MIGVDKVRGSLTLPVRKVREERRVDFSMRSHFAVGSFLALEASRRKEK
jgi:hypothetical protein